MPAPYLAEVQSGKAKSRSAHLAGRAPTRAGSILACPSTGPAREVDFLHGQIEGKKVGGDPVFEGGVFP